MWKNTLLIRITYHATAATAAPGGKIHSHCPGTYSNLSMFIISSKQPYIKVLQTFIQYKNYVGNIMVNFVNFRRSPHLPDFKLLIKDFQTYETSLKDC